MFGGGGRGSRGRRGASGVVVVAAGVAIAGDRGGWLVVIWRGAACRACGGDGG